MNIFKRLFRKAAVIVVTLYANYTYHKGVEAAQLRHAREHTTIYLAAKTFHPDRLATYDKAQFKAEKRVFGMAAQLLTMNTLRSQCYYHTADRFGKGGMSGRDIDIRRKAFVKERLRLAGLI